MTKAEFLVLVRQYGSECGGDGYNVDRLWDEIVVAVSQHWVERTPEDVAQAKAPHPRTVPVRAGSCTRPPLGWYCTRDEGHDGPCPTWPTGRFIDFTQRIPPLQGMPETQAALERMPATMPDLTTAYGGKLRPACGCPPGTEHTCDLRCAAIHDGPADFAGFMALRRCVRDVGHVRPWGRPPLMWTGGDVRATHPEQAMLRAEEHMDDKGQTWT